MIALFFFGGQQLPEVAKGLGTGLREFQRATAGGADDEAAPAVPQPRQLSPGSATGPGDQGEPTGLPHDRHGAGRGCRAVRVELERSPRDGCGACGPRGPTGRHVPRHHGSLDRRREV